MEVKITIKIEPNSYLFDKERLRADIFYGFSAITGYDMRQLDIVVTE